MAPTPLERKVARHDNDIAASYSIVARLEKGQKRLEGKVARLDGRLARVEGKVDGLATQLATVIDLVSRDRR